MSNQYDFSNKEPKKLGEVMAELAYLKKDPKMAMVAYSIEDFLQHSAQKRYILISFNIHIF